MLAVGDEGGGCDRVYDDEAKARSNSWPPLTCGVKLFKTETIPFMMTVGEMWKWRTY